MSRPVGEIPDGMAVMVDANVFVYALVPQAPLHAPCHALLERGARGGLPLVTTVAIVADVLHRVMVLEVLAEGRAQSSAEAVTLLKRQPQAITQLTRYRTVLRDLRQTRVDILPLTYQDLRARGSGAAIRICDSLLTGNFDVRFPWLAKCEKARD